MSVDENEDLKRGLTGKVISESPMDQPSNFSVQNNETINAGRDTHRFAMGSGSANVDYEDPAEYGCEDPEYFQKHPDKYVE